MLLVRAVVDCTILQQSCSCLNISVMGTWLHYDDEHSKNVAQNTDLFPVFPRLARSTYPEKVHHSLASRIKGMPAHARRNTRTHMSSSFG